MELGDKTAFCDSVNYINRPTVL